MINEYLKIIKAKEIHLDELTKMAIDLWPNNDFNELRHEIILMMKGDKDIFLLSSINESIVGFIQMSIRTDYVEGANSSPVGFVEGIYIKPMYRFKGIARELVSKGEEWAKSMGCTQIGSDIEMNNLDSYKFHQNIGFKEANRIICFIKDID